jgi:hypothetical protein
MQTPLLQCPQPPTHRPKPYPQVPAPGATPSGQTCRMPARIRRAMQVAGWCSGALRHGWTVCVVLIAGAREAELEVGQGAYEDLRGMACRIEVCAAGCGLWSLLSQRGAIHDAMRMRHKQTSRLLIAAPAIVGASCTIRVPVSRALDGQRTLRLISLVRSLECACERFGTVRASRVRSGSGECYTGSGSPDIGCWDYLMWASMFNDISSRAMCPHCLWGCVVTTPLIVEAR